MKRLILWLIQVHLGLKKGQHFKFANQKSISNYYYFNSNGIMKVDPTTSYTRPSHVNFNYILSDECNIVKIDMKGGG